MDEQQRIDHLSTERRALLALKQMQHELDELKRERAEPIAIIGMGCRFPGGIHGPEAFWQFLVEGRDAITEVPRERYAIDDFYDPDGDAPGTTVSRWGGFLDAVDQFDPLFFGISPREANDLDPQQRLLLEVSWEAMERAGILPEKLSGSQTGVFVGLFNRDYFDLQLEQMVHDGIYSASPYTGTGSGPSFAAGRLSYILGLQGPSMVIDTVCSSSHVAVHLACQSLRNNECTLAFAGAANIMVHPLSTIVTSKMRALSPEGHSKTFDASADGFVRGEGCAVVLLKRLSHARADGDPILALIRGSAVIHDGHSNGLTAPNGLSQQIAIRQALANARVSPAQISYVETHGTGTALGDPIEVDALKAVLGQPRPDGLECVLGSVKTNLGHLEACAGMAGLIKTVLCMQHGQLPPLLHLKQLNPHISLEGTPFVLPTTLRAWPAGSERKYAGVSGAGLSGTNAHIILEEAPVREKSNDVPLPANAEPASYLLPLSARDPEALRQLMLVYQDELTQPGKALTNALLRDICGTASMRRTHYPYRVAVAGQSHKELASRLTSLSEQKQTDAISKENMAGPVFLFAGQGTQWAGMGRQLYEQEPVFRAKLVACDALLKPYVSWSLLEELQADESHTRLHETEVAQPALFAIQVALAALWSSWGIVPGAVVGHSVGEIAAAHVAGVFTLEEAVRIVACRGRIMQAAHGLGRMVAVELPEEQARSILTDYTGRLSLAAVNSPTSVVLSGDAQALEEVLRRSIEPAGIFARRLQVDYAFHSSPMEQFRAPLVEALQGLRPRAASIPLISTVTGQQCSGEAYDAAYWGSNMCQEVRFGPAIETLIELGYQTFLELSPRPALLQAVRNCLAYHSQSGLVLSSFKPGRAERVGLFTSLGALYAQGYDIHWEQVYTREPYTVVPLPTYQWQRKSYWWSSHKPSTTRRARGSSQTSSTHPLLGKRLHSALKETIFEATIDHDAPVWLKDHRVYGTAVLPAAAYVEMILVGAKTVLNTDRARLCDMVIHQALYLPAESSYLLQTIFHSSPDKMQATVQIFACLEDKDEDQWILYVSGRVEVADNADSRLENEIAFGDIQERCLEFVERRQHYQGMHHTGMQYGASFQGVQHIWRRDGEALASVALPEQLEAESKDYLLHPALLDACLQTVAASLVRETGSTSTRSYLPFSIDTVQVYTQPEKSVWCHTQVYSEGAGVEQAETEAMLVADIQILNAYGQCLAEVQGLRLRQASREALRLPTQQRLQDWLYEMRWEPQMYEDLTERSSAVPTTEKSSWLIFCDRGGAGVVLARRLQNRGEACLLVFAQQEQMVRSSDYLSVDPFQEQHFHQLFEQHFSREHACRGIIYLWGLDEVEAEQQLTADLEASQHLICGSIVYITHAAAQRLDRPRLWIVTQGGQAILEDERGLRPAQASVWGLGRVIAREPPDISCRLIDLDPAHEATTEIALFLQELLTLGSEEQIAFRASRRYVARLVRSSLIIQEGHQPPEASSNVRPDGPSEALAHFRADSSYLITGGCGAIGLIVARWMVERGGVKSLLLVSRSGASREAQATIQELEQTGARVVVMNVDISQEQQVAQMLETIQKTLPPLRGIIHAAGVLDDGLLLQQDWTRFAKVMAPKVQGSWNLHRLTQALPLDFFVLFSSGVALLGSAGQGNYAAANAFMDALAWYRRAQGLPATSMNWGAWAGVGMATSAAVERRLAKDGMQSIDVVQGMEIFAQLLRHNPAQIAVLPIDWEKFPKRLAVATQSSFLKKLLDESLAWTQPFNSSFEEEAASGLLQNLREADPNDQLPLLQHYVEQAVKQMLALDEDFALEPGQDLFELGMDSLSAIELRNHFQAILRADEGRAIPARLLFEHPTVEDLAGYLLSVVPAL